MWGKFAHIISSTTIPIQAWNPYLSRVEGGRSEKDRQSREQWEHYKQLAIFE